MKDVIKETQNVLSNGGNVIKTRDDRELILVDKDGNIQNADSCGWLPENDGKINAMVDFSISVRAPIATLWFWNNQCR